MENDHVDLISRISSLSLMYMTEYISDLRANEDSEHQHISDFCADFVSNANAWRIVTESDFFDVMKNVQERQTITFFVFGLRGFVISQFSKAELDQIVFSLSMANSNRSNPSSVYPEDAPNWAVTQTELYGRYQSNLWIVPLLALGLQYGKRD